MLMYSFECLLSYWLDRNVDTVLTMILSGGRGDGTNVDPPANARPPTQVLISTYLYDMREGGL